jgi:hypothetical protein
MNKKSKKNNKKYNKKLLGGRVIIKKPITKKIKVIDDIYDSYISYYYDRGYKGKDLDITSNSMNWGLGVEHEAQLFHISKNNMDSIKNTNILFDSQESTCFLTHDKEDTGSCCKSILPKKTGCYYDNPTFKKLMKTRVNLKKEDSEWLKKIPWEYSGRSNKNCNPKTILERAPILMPEFITGNHKNRTIESIYEELLFIEKKFIDLQMKNPYTKQKVKKYGEIRTVPYGSVDNILVPLKPTIGDLEYSYYNYKYLDYVGSYHFTFTLPCRETITNKKFIELHQNFANQFQWIEPILIASLFSGDPRTITEEDYEKKIRGSFRILATGWGNLAGSDIRKMGTKGLDRYANTKSVWRKSLDYTSTKKLMDCNSTVSINSGSILSSDIRTFGFDYTDNCQGKECPKVSGAPMVYPNGMEIRIFDHFNSIHLLDVLRFMIYLAENSRVFETNNYVYDNLSWKNSVRKVMKEGWKAILSDSYLNELRKNLNLELNFRNKTAIGFMKAVNDELFMKHKNGLFSTLMIEKSYKDAPKIIELNRFAWQISFNDKYKSTIKNLMKDNFKTGDKITMDKFEQVLFTKFKKTIWKNYVIDILYALESKPYKMLELKYPEGTITSIKYIK